MRLVFVRHGEPDYAKDCLTETGKRQAEYAAGLLKEENIEEIWTSPFGRAAQTAEYTAGLLGLPVRTLECIHELEWGTRGGEVYADGHPWDTADEMVRKGIDLNDPNWRSSPYFIDNRVVEAVDYVEAGMDEWLSNYGYVRNGLYYDHLTGESEHKTVAVFCHGGSSSAAIGHILNLTFPYVCALLHIGFAGYAILRFDTNKGMATLPVLECINDGGYMNVLNF